MSYYTEKKRAVAIIDEMYAQGKNETEIQYKIEKSFGFGKRMINDRLSVLDKLNGAYGVSE